MSEKQKNEEGKRQGKKERIKKWNKERRNKEGEV